jgi:hypothetical protein
MVSNRSKKLNIICSLFILFTVAVMPFGGMHDAVAQEADVGKSSNPYLVETFVDDDGRPIDKIIDPGRPPETKAAVATVPESNAAAGINILSNVPAFEWSYGCSPTAAAMLFGYYDNTGYPNMYTGPTNGGVCPMDNSIWGPGIGGSDAECPLSATHMGIDGRVTKGHVDDYWVQADSAAPDPYIGNWEEHMHGDCTGDFMGSNQYLLGNRDGVTSFNRWVSGDPTYDFTLCEPDERDGCHGLRLFAESRGYTVETNFSQYIYGQAPGGSNGFTFSDFQSEIDAGRPVLIHVEGHTMLGYGYNTAGQIIYIHDTWDHGDHQMTWGGTYQGCQHYAATVIQLEPAVVPNEPPNAPSNPSPADHATGIAINAGLSWTGGDPDVGDTVTYDVYFGTGLTPPLVSDDQPGTAYDPGALSEDTIYYWYIVATDNHGASTAGPLWEFTTEPPGQSDIRTPIDPVGFGDVNVGSNLDKKTTIYNDGNAILTINSITRTSGSLEFSYIGPATPFDIAPLGSQDITIRFTPTSEGLRNATFNVNSNDPDEANVTFDASGNGVIGGPPDITVFPTSFDVTLPTDIIQNYALTISNDGGVSLTYSINDKETTGAEGAAGGENLFLVEPASMVLKVPLESKPVELQNAGPAATGWQEIMADGFEGMFPGVWELWVPSGATDAYWGKDNYRAHSGSYSAFCAKSGTAGVNPPSDYPNDMEAWLIHGPFSLADATDAELEFYFWLDSESDYDSLGLYASINGEDFYGRGWTGDYGGWKGRSFDLTNVYGLGNLCGESQVWIAFIFESDTVGNDRGAFIDDVVLRKYVGAANNPPNTPSAPSPANHTIGISVNANLSWAGGDPDAGDIVTYDVYFGTSATPPLVSNDQLGTAYDPETLTLNAKYYWKIIATDSHGAATAGPLWDFTTIIVGDCPWLDENPKSGSVPGGGSSDVTVTINTTGLTVGSTYTAEIVIATNDPDENPKVVPVTLHVREPAVTWNMPWGLDADAAAVNIWTYPADAAAVTLADVDSSMPAGLLIWYYGGAGVGWRFYKKGWGASNTLETLTPGKGYIGIVPTASVWEIPQG